MTPAEQLANNIAGAAAMVVTSALQHGKPLGFATLEDDHGELGGIVVVALNPAEARALRAFVASRGGKVTTQRVN